MAEGIGVFSLHHPSVIGRGRLWGCSKSPVLSACHGSSREKGKKGKTWPSEVSQFSLSGKSQGIRRGAAVTSSRADVASHINQEEERGHFHEKSTKQAHPCFLNPGVSMYFQLAS